MLAMGALALGTTTIAATSQGGASAAPVDSPISIWTPKKLVVESYGGRVYTDFGVKVVAPVDNAFEVRSVRPTYRHKIVTTWSSGSETGSLPVGTVTNFGVGLPTFSVVVVRNRAGKIVQRSRQNACFSGYSQRVDPGRAGHLAVPVLLPVQPVHPRVGDGGPGRARRLGLRRGVLRTPRAPRAGPLQRDREDRAGVRPGDRHRAQGRRAHHAAGGEEGQRGGVPRTGPTPAASARQPAPRPAAHRPVGPSIVPPAGSPAPDLRSLPAWGIDLNGKGTALRFSATVWNGGTSPLVVDGFRNEAHPDHMDAYQYFYDTDGNETGHQEVGEMHWHAQNHNHWHFEDFAQYRLLNADKTLAVRSTKQSFCLANTDAVDYTLPGSDWRPENTDLSTACGGEDALSIREVLSAGSGDTYMQYRAGQAFRIGNLPNGVY